MSSQCVLDEIIEQTLEGYAASNKNRHIAAKNFLKYGMGGYPIQVGIPQPGFCNNEDPSQNPCEVPREDLRTIIARLHEVLLQRGYKSYAAEIAAFKK